MKRLFRYRATYLQHETNKIGKINTESLAMPVIMRGSDGKIFFVLFFKFLFHLSESFQTNMIA